MKKYMPFLLILAAFFWSCRPPEEVPEEFLPTDTHREYSEALTALDLEDTDMGMQWLTAADPSSNPAALSLLPFQERRIFDPGVPDAAYYLIEGLKGQKVTITIDTDSDAGYFADLFGLDEEFYPEGPPEEEWEGRNFEQVAVAREIAALREKAEGETETAGTAADEEADGPGTLTGPAGLMFEPKTHRFYLLRIQPRLLEGGEFIITFNSDPLLSWPVPDSGKEDVISFFGAPRDGGERVHHGIDIIAPRGTPVLAVDDVPIYRIQVRERGGNTVFLRDAERGLVYYYAHLDTWAEDIERGLDVSPGMELGTVGNTGNARWSPPHLHFGIYRTSWRGALDPWYFFIDVKDLPPNRTAVPFPPDRETGPAGDSAEGSIPEKAVFYRTYASRALFTQSPAARDREGKELGEKGKPVLTRDWGTDFRGEKGDLRLVASRAEAYGYMGPDRRIWWQPLQGSFDGD